MACSFVHNSLVANITVDNFEWTPFEEPIEITESAADIHKIIFSNLLLLGFNGFLI